MDKSVGSGLPIGSLTTGEVCLPPVSTSKTEEGEVLVVVGCEADDLLARVWEVEVNAIVMAEDAERPRGFGDWVGLVQRLGV